MHVKYMSFNSSCAYTGLANMLAHLGVHTLVDYRREMAALEQQPFDRPRLRELMDTHLRAFLLDALTIMHLAREDALAQQLTILQAALLDAVRAGAEGPLAPRATS